MIKSFVFLIQFFKSCQVLSESISVPRDRDNGVCEKEILEFSKNNVCFSCAWEYIKKMVSFKQASRDQRELIEK